jgi:hypothetical protein
LEDEMNGWMRRLAAGSLLASFAWCLGACAQRTTTPTDEPAEPLIPECEAYLQAYARCLGASSEVRLQETRKSLAAAALQSPDLVELKTVCQAGTQRFARGCQ